MLDPPAGAEPRSTARCEELIYLGDHIRTRVSVAGHDDFIVKVPNSRAAARPARRRDAVRVGWRRRGLPRARRGVSAIGPRRGPGRPEESDRPGRRTGRTE